MKKMQPYVKKFAYAFVITFGILGATLVVAWTGPTQTAPNCTSGNPGCDAPLNVSSSNQIKTGTITAGGLSAPTYCIGASCISSWPGAGQWTTSGTNIYNANTGNVGVGNNNPQTKLDVTGGIRQSGSTALRVENTFGGVPTGSSGVGLELGQVSNLGFIQSYDRTNNVYSPLYVDESTFVVRPGGAAKLYVNSNGVGVGGAPSYNFDVTGSNGAWGEHISNSGATSYGLFITAGNSASDNPLVINNAANTVALFSVNGAGNSSLKGTLTAGDVCAGAKCLSSISSGGSPFGGLYTWNSTLGRCDAVNGITGACSCPASAPTVAAAGYFTYPNGSGVYYENLSMCY